MVKDHNKSIVTTEINTTKKPNTQSGQFDANNDKQPNYFILLFGGIILLVVSVLITLAKNKYQPETNPVVIETPKTLTLQLTSPKEGELAVENEILVAGNTGFKSTLVVYTENDEVIIESNDAGDFETTVKLVPGINSLIVSAFTADGQEENTNMNIVYDNEI